MKNIIKKIQILTLLITISFFSLPVYAASLTNVSGTLTRTKVNTTANHTIVFTTPSGIQDGDTVALTFPATSFTMGASLTGVTINGGVVGSASWSAPTLTITADADSTVSVSGVATIIIGSNQITNPSTAGSKLVTIGGTFGDTGTFAYAISTEDQFTVTAAVDPSITFVLNDSLVELGTLAVSTIKSDTTSFEVNTNANSGYTVYAYEDGNLRSGANDINDVVDGTVTIGSEEYGMSTTKSGQQFPQTSGSSASAITGSNKQTASSSGPASSDITTLTLHASISGITASGAYSHVVTLIAVGNF